MARYSPQDLDRIENERLDRHDTDERVMPIATTLSAPMFKSRQYAHPEVAPLANNHHGWKPTLDDMERR